MVSSSARRKSVHNSAFDAETERINENKKLPANMRPHKFKAAQWTHPNGHPRCVLCGDEEPIGGICRPEVDLAEPDISDSQTMVAFQIPSDIAGGLAVSGGVPADELHITLGYFGEIDDSADEIVRMVTECLAEYGESLAGTIGGILAFPKGDQGVPWAVPVDVPGISRLQLRLVDHFRGSDYPIREDHGYTPHVTLAYDDPQDPVEPIPVKFGSVVVVSGDELVAEVPLGASAGADEPEGGTLSSDSSTRREPKVELSALLERARAISDPDQKAAVRAKILELSISTAERHKAAARGQTISGTESFPIRNEQDLKNAIRAFGRAGDKAAAKKHIISRARSLGLSRLIPKQWKVDLSNEIAERLIDLALTKDGRKSFKRQGKWGHGFVPLDEKAKQAKAKGSPIAMQRINRLFGQVKRKPTEPAAAKKTPPIKTRPPVTVKKEGGGTVTAKSAALLGGSAQAKDATASQRVRVGAKREESKGGGRDQRAIRPWDSLPDDQKTIRNGKRYVIATFNGEQQLTEWVGPNQHAQVKADPSKVRYRTISRATAAKFSSGELRNLLEVPGQPESVRKVLNAALKAAQDKAARRQS